MSIDQNLGKLSKLMEEAQKMQQKMQDAQKEISDLVVEGRTGKGEVVIKMNGRHEVTARDGVKISSSLLDEDIEMLQDLVAYAINDAAKKIEKVSKDKIVELTAGLPVDLMKDDKK